MTTTLSEKALEVACRKLAMSYGWDPDKLVESPSSSSDTMIKVPTWEILQQAVMEFQALQHAVEAGILFDNSNPQPEI